MNKIIGIVFLTAVFCLTAIPGFAENPAAGMRQAVKELQHLTELLKDGQKGYQMSASDVQSGDLKRLFREYSVQRARFLNDLRKEVTRLGGDPDKGGSAKGALHRGWIKARTAISKNNDKAVVDEVLRGEGAALKGYQEALSKDLSDETRKLVEKQRKDIQAAYDRFKSIDLEQR